MDWFLYDKDFRHERFQDILDDVNRKCQEHILERKVEHKNEKKIFV